MAIVSRSIPTLLRGVSQASDSTKQADHCDIQDNADSSPVQGLQKRSGTQYIATLANFSTDANVHLHTINRDITERYIAAFTDGAVKVYDIDGTVRTVHTPDGTTYLATTNPRDEIKTVTIADFTFVVNTSKSIAMDPSLSPYNQDTLGGQVVSLENQAVVFFNQVSDKTSYTVTVNSTTATVDTSSHDPLSTTRVATEILEKLLGTNSQTPTTGSALSGFTISQNGPVLWIRKNDGDSFTIDSNDTQGNSHITLVKNSVQRFSDLPTVSPNGYIVEVKGDDTTNFDNYFVRFVSNNGGDFEEGQWEESVKPGITFKFNYDTMPHVLIRQTDNNFRFARVDGDNYGISSLQTAATYTSTTGNNTVTITKTNHGFATGDLVNVVKVSGSLNSGQFVIEKVNDDSFTYITATNEGANTNANCTIGQGFSIPKWGERTVGDLTTAPTSSFVGNKINNVLFFRNRLGFLSGDNVILSRVSEFFNFFPETVTTVIDSDPIDVTASHTKVSILKNSKTMGEQLILFSDQTQFVLSSSSDSLTPKTANVNVATEFENDTGSIPVSSGRSIYFLIKKGLFAGVREYIAQEDLAIKDAADITIHVPKYIPANIFKMAISTNEDVLVLLGSDNPNKLYINRWLYGDRGEKILNAWSTFVFNSSRTILNVDFIDTDLYLVVKNSNNVVSLEKLPFEPGFAETNSTFEFHLDHKITEASTGVSIAFNSSTNTTTWTLPYRTYAAMSIVGRHLASGETSTFIAAANQSATTLKSGQVISTTTTNTDGSTTTVTATGDYRLSKVIIGEPYEMHYRFSSQRLTEQAGGSTEIIGGRLQLHHFYIKFEDSGFFKVEVTPENRDTSTHNFTGTSLGAASSSIGTVNLETGTFRVPVMSRADRVNIDVKNNTFLPTRLNSAEYEARFHIRSRRV
tara:strand:+ start:607 stop:3354 length:2748 start_codon:yes stop_codon:yes gene_type:complete